jgi:hypothetical protein
MEVVRKYQIKTMENNLCLVQWMDESVGVYVEYQSRNLVLLVIDNALGEI